MHNLKKGQVKMEVTSKLGSKKVYKNDMNQQFNTALNLSQISNKPEEEFQGIETGNPYTTQLIKTNARKKAMKMNRTQSQKSKGIVLVGKFNLKSK